MAEPDARHAVAVTRVWGRAAAPGSADGAWGHPLAEGVDGQHALRPPSSAGQGAPAELCGPLSRTCTGSLFALKPGSCHRLRHTFASNMLEQGAEIVSIRELLGHASIASSERYAKVSNQKVKQVYLKTIRKVMQQSKV